jgi:hypothetical protein
MNQLKKYIAVVALAFMALSGGQKVVAQGGT